jgi:hypothetical protein
LDPALIELVEKHNSAVAIGAALSDSGKSRSIRDRFSESLQMEQYFRREIVMRDGLSADSLFSGAFCQISFGSERGDWRGTSFAKVTRAIVIFSSLNPLTMEGQMM